MKLKFCIPGRVFDDTPGTETGGGVDQSYVDGRLVEKQDVIDDLEEIRGGAALGATAVQSLKTVNGQSLEGDGNIVISGGGGISQESDPTVPSHVKEIAAADIEDWNAKYSKPSSGIPKTDLASAVQSSLSKADTALQSHQQLKTVNGQSLVGDGNIVIQGGGGDFSEESDPTVPYYVKEISQADISRWNGKYEKPGTGIPPSHLSSVVQASLQKADAAVQDISDLVVIVDSKYAKDAQGIPKTDLHADVQASLNKADAAVTDISGLATKAELSAKYSKPSSGIPKYDLHADVQASLNKADTALQVHQSIDHLASKHSVSLKQDALTEVQLAAVNSGIHGVKVAEYDGYAERLNDLEVLTAYISPLQIKQSNTVSLTPNFGENYLCLGVQILQISPPPAPADNGGKAAPITIRWVCTAAPTVGFIGSGWVWSGGGERDYCPCDEITIAYGGSANIIIQGSSLGDVDLPQGGVNEELDPTVPQYVKNISVSDIAGWNAKYTKASAGIPEEDLSADVRTKLGQGVSALSSLSNFASVGALNTKYTFPYDGIPKYDLHADVQASLNKADTALQVHQSIDHLASKHSVSLKQDALTEVQLAAVNSGIHGVKVAEYDGYAERLNDLEQQATYISPLQIKQSNTVSLTPNFGENYLCLGVQVLGINPPVSTEDNGTRAKPVTIRWNCASTPSVVFNGSGWVFANGEMPVFGLCGEISIAYGGDKHFVLGSSFSPVQV